MKHTFLTEAELINKCPCGWSILSYAESLGKSDVKWSFLIAHQNAEDDALFLAVFDQPSKPDAGELTIECRCTLDQHICRVVTAAGKTPDDNDHQYPQN